MQAAATEPFGQRWISDLMTSLAMIADTQDAIAPVTSRAGLARFMRRVCAEIGAAHYMLVEPSVERGSRSARIITPGRRRPFRRRMRDGTPMRRPCHSTGSNGSWRI
jgi:hypothetical protein